VVHACFSFISQSVEIGLAVCLGFSPEDALQSFTLRLVEWFATTH